ncbi:MAG: phosphatidate cytidylyltransferase [Coriobacteriales bacterium]|nr:phosphatidate cytidylyltransferase [Coriobacteriales bacterium]
MRKKKARQRDDEKVSVGLDRGIDKLEDRRDSREERRLAGELKGQRVRGWTEKLLTRTMSGAVYVLVIIACLFLGVLPTAALMAAMGWLCCSEFFRICRMAGRTPNEIVGLTAAIAYPLVATIYGLNVLLAITCLLVLLVAMWYVFSPRANIADVAVSVFGPIYTSMPLSCIAMVRASDAGFTGAWLALFVIAALWLEDSFAYLIGSSLGSHKMAPRISPNKSWEGFYGGFLGCILVWSIAAIFHVGGITWPIAIACALLEGFFAVMGDLFESRIKRGVGVKDSGNLMPGHGGLLDRADSMLFGGVIAYFVLLLGGLL